MPAVGDGGAAFAAFLAEKRPLIEVSSITPDARPDIFSTPRP